MAEKILWQGKSSQMTNFWIYLVCILADVLILIFYFIIVEQIDFPYLYIILLVALAIPLIIMIWKWLQVYFRKYQLTDERLKVREGILSVRIDETELFRIKDLALEKPFWLRIFRLSDILFHHILPCVFLS